VPLTLETKPETVTEPTRAPHRMKLGVLKEIHAGEKRVAVVPRALQIRAIPGGVLCATVYAGGSGSSCSWRWPG